MLILSGVQEFPSGPATHALAASFARRLGAPFEIVDGRSAADLAADPARAGDQVLIFGHAPPRGISAALRDAPYPVVLAPTPAKEADWDEVLLAGHGEQPADGTAATAAVLAEKLEATLRVLLVSPSRPSSAWRLYDSMRRMTTVAGSVSPGVAIEVELRDGSPVRQVLRAADEHEGTIVVVAADPRPSWLDALRPSLTSELAHDSRRLVVVVPPAASLGADRYRELTLQAS